MAISQGLEMSASLSFSISTTLLQAFNFTRATRSDFDLAQVTFGFN